MLDRSRGHLPANLPRETPREPSLSRPILAALRDWRGLGFGVIGVVGLLAVWVVTP